MRGKKHSVWRGLAAGLAGGAAASLVMGQVHSLITKKLIKPKPDQRQEEDSTVKAAATDTETAHLDRPAQPTVEQTPVENAHHDEHS